jgi:hypothetical protein
MAQAVHAYLSYGTPRWVSVDIKPGVLMGDEQVRASQPPRLQEC